MNILIPNASSPKNLGDQAILESLLGLLSLRFPDAKIVVHSYDPELHSQHGVIFKNSICSYVAFDDRRLWSRTVRSLGLALTFVAKLFNIDFIFSSSLRDIMQDYNSADLIVFAGGGYMRSKPGLKQGLNLFLQLSHFVWAYLCKGRGYGIVAPVSFGPFSYRFQEFLFAKILAKARVVITREHISFERLKLLGLANLVEMSDVALLHSPAQNGAQSKNLIGFTLRRWGTEQEQKLLEHEVVQAIVMLSQKYNGAFLPVVQVHAPEFGDDDLEVAERVAKKLRDAGLQVNEPIILNNVAHALSVYNGLDLVLGMRMHSNILAALAGTPFVAIAYEHKTQGIAKSLGVGDYVLSVNGLKANVLGDILIRAYDNLDDLRQTLRNALVGTTQKDAKAWIDVLAKN